MLGGAETSDTVRATAREMLAGRAGVTVARYPDQHVLSILKIGPENAVAVIGVIVDLQLIPGLVVLRKIDRKLLPGPKRTVGNGHEFLVVQRNVILGNGAMRAIAEI